MNADALARGDARSSAPAARLHRRHRHRRDGECARARDIAANLAIDDVFLEMKVAARNFRASRRLA
jgi:hypothetical protein